MNNREIIASKKEIFIYLSKRQLKEAFNALKKLATKTNNWQTAEHLNELETNYKYMLHYLFEGVNDPERDKVYLKLVRSLYEIADDLGYEDLKEISSNIFYEKLRSESFKGILLTGYINQLKEITDSLSLFELLEDSQEKETKKRQLSIEREHIESSIFNNVFVSPRAKKEDINIYISLLDNIDLSTRGKCLIISALTLNLFHRFDALKVQVLMHAASSNDLQVRARAIVGLVIVMQMYDTRWPLYPELERQIDILSEDSSFRKRVLITIIQLIRSRETEEISKRISEEIIPEMMKFNNLAGRKLNMEDLMGETDFAEKNPEWQKELEESGLGKKLQEYSSLQMEGADVFHSTFSGLKHFPFFSDLSNWFLPFDPSFSEISDLFPEDKKSTLLQAAVIDSGQMCNSDKYSFCLSLLQISSAQREIMINRMGAETEDMKQMQKDMKAINPYIDEEVISNQYIQDLYRFFKINPYKGSFFDIFKLSINFYDKKSILPLISNIESMKKIAFYCFEKNNFKEALDVFNSLIKNDTTSDDIWQKIGYCKQMLGDQKGALDAYLQADLVNPNNSWIMRRIAQQYKALKEIELALEYYKKAIKLTPESTLIELNIGHCYLELNRYEEALNTYFKVELLDNKSSKTERPIAWTAFLLDKYDLAKKYYQKILMNKPNVHDYLNAGHVELSSGNKKEAINYYKQAVILESDLMKVQSLFESDKEYLIKKGVDDEIFNYLWDQIKYMVE